jgi:hypothetical protein
VLLSPYSSVQRVQKMNSDFSVLTSGVYSILARILGVFYCEIFFSLSIWELYIRANCPCRGFFLTNFTS